MTSHDIENELAEWRCEDDDLARRYREEQKAHYERLEELLLRARDAGMSNKQIAVALNAPEDDLPEDALRLNRYTPQRVTSMMRLANDQARWAVELFVRDAFEEADDAC
jgi:DNA-binding transcriptional MerR regulator